MTTPATHIPAPPIADRLRTPLLVSLVVGALIATALVFGLATDGPAPSTTSDATTATTEEGVLDRIARANAAATSASTDAGLLDRIARTSAATTGSTGTSSAVTAEPTRQQVLEELYRINGVVPPAPVVPPTAR